MDKEKNKTKTYKYFFGIDISKDTFVTFMHGDNMSKSYSNDTRGICNFYKEYKDYLAHGFVSLEVTGGYELQLCDFMVSKNISIHRAHPKQMKRFIESLGNIAKTDNLDAQSISVYSKERHQTAILYHTMSLSDKKLFHLVKRRDDLVRMRSSEKNKLSAPDNQFYQESLKKMIKYLSQEIDSLNTEINDIVNTNQVIMQKKEVISEIPGIADKLSTKILVILPELGIIGNKQIAALAGVAPCAKDSGKIMKYRKTNHGRQDVKTSLMIAALSASRSKSDLGQYYTQLIQRGKKPMVALVALMRKIIIRANAKIRDYLTEAKLETKLNNKIKGDRTARAASA